MSGQISGVVVHGDGSKARHVKVSGLAEGVLGGTVGPVYTDDNGGFCLSWSSDSGLAKVYVSGDTVATHVRNGSHVTLRIS